MLFGGGSAGLMTGGDTGTMWTQQPSAAGPDRGLPGWDGVDAIVVLVVGAAALKTRLSDLPIGSLIFAGVWVLLGALAVTRLVQRFGSAWLTWTLTRQPTLSALLILAFASCLWSLDPTLTVRTAAEHLLLAAVGPVQAATKESGGGGQLIDRRARIAARPEDPEQRLLDVGGLERARTRHGSKIVCC
jgi:hypothetical protein